MKIGIIGSRRRNTEEDCTKLEICFANLLLNFRKELKTNRTKMVTIVTGDCDEGGDFFAKYLATMYGSKLDVKRIKDPQTGEEMDFKNHKWFDWFTMCTIFYDRNEEIAKEPLDYLIALVTPDRKGGTENTIRHFRRLHKDWKDKLIIL